MELSAVICVLLILSPEKNLPYIILYILFQLGLRSVPKKLFGSISVGCILIFCDTHLHTFLFDGWPAMPFTSLAAIAIDRSSFLLIMTAIEIYCDQLQVEPGQTRWQELLGGRKSMEEKESL